MAWGSAVPHTLKVCNTGMFKSDLSICIIFRVQAFYFIQAKPKNLNLIQNVKQVVHGLPGTTVKFEVVHMNCLNWNKILRFIVKLNAGISNKHTLRLPLVAHKVLISWMFNFLCIWVYIWFLFLLPKIQRSSYWIRRFHFNFYHSCNWRQEVKW